MVSRAVARPGLPREVAGVDLGSNSFHLLVARAEEDGRVHVLDRLREPVRLAAGLDEDRELTPRALRRAVEALERFGERTRDMPDGAVRAVGTNTLRQARNGADVEDELSEALGHPVEIISGREEARLIYSGVAHDTVDLEGRLLVLDIGGGSTECVIGEGLEPRLLGSLYMGCVGYTERFFPEGRISRGCFRHAHLAAALELSSIQQGYCRLGWERAVGSSGTVLAVSEVLRANGWSEGPITAAALEKLEQELVAQKRIEELSLPGLEGDRAAVFPGGVAILAAACEQLRIDELHTSQGALREGLVHELLGREVHGDPRERSVETFASRYKADRAHAERVERTALQLFEQANTTWKHDDERARRLLAWAARVHEIGLSIAYSGYHKHGAYLLEHAELPSFSMDEQQILAVIVGAHRRKIPRESFDALHGKRRKLALDLTLLLRLAVRLHRSRSDEPLPEIRLKVRKRRLELGFPEGWLEERPLTRADLEEEASQIQKLGHDLSF